MCDDREMHRGDACRVSSTGGSHTESYEDRLEGQQLLAGAGVGLGALLGLAGVWWAATGEIVRRRHGRGG